MSRVYLVGAGPGDPELLTLKGRRVLGLADSVLYDHLANPALLRYARPDAERVYVGKKRSLHTFTQEEITSMLIERAARGLTVVRLKGGDPFLFGRGGEELQGLREAGIPYEVVPGITAPLGIAASTGVPLTHRDYASMVTFVTGHEAENIDWNRNATSGTVVIFMGLHQLRQISGQLIAAGRSSDTPAMAVRWGTRADQRVVTGTLGNLADLAESEHLLPPATVIVGEVVRLREQLDWFGKRPLAGQSVIVTRAQDQAAELADPLRDAGADVIELPTIDLAPLDDYTDCDRYLANLPQYDWILFTSANAVTYFLSRLPHAGRDARSIRGRICAIGSATARALADAHLLADLIPEDSSSEGVVAAFSAVDLTEARILLPRAEEARDVVPVRLRERGVGAIDVVPIYRNRMPSDAVERVQQYLAGRRRADWITFTSGSTVSNWLAAGGQESLAGTRIATIGPATSEVVRKHGFAIDCEAEPHSVQGLVRCLQLSVSTGYLT